MIQEVELKERRHCPQCDLYKDVRSFYRNKKGEYKPFCRKCTMETGKKNYWEKHHASFSKVATPHKASSRRRSADKTRQQFIDLMAQGMTVKEACAKIDRSLATYKQWRMEIPGFREQVDSVRSVHAGKKLPNEWVGDFGYFRKVYFGFETFPHQQALVSALENTEPQHITLCLLPPEHGKSTTIEDWVCRKLALDPNHRFGIVSEGTNQARKMVRRIQRRMNPPRTTDYTAKYGPFYDDGQEREGKPWTADYFTVAKADHDERDASVSAVGSTSAIYGARIDTLIVDDIQSRRSINRTEELLRTFRQDFLSRVGKTGRTIIIGTRVGIGDFYERLIEEDLPHKIIILPAFNEDGEALCPDLWNQEQLTEKRRQVGEEVWECAYQQTPSANQLSTFTEDMIEMSLDEDRGVGMIRPGDFTVVGLDPALGGGNAVTAFSFGVDKLNLLDCEKLYNLARVEDILARVEEFAIRYKPRQVVVERDAFQKGLAADERLRLLGKRYGFDIIAHTTSRNKSDEVMGVASMAGSFMRGEFRIPYKDELTRLRVQPLLKELRNWRPNVSGKLLEQDLTMSCWFVWRTWLQMRQSINAKPKDLPRPSWAKGQWRRHRVA